MGEPELQPCRWCGSPAITNASLDLVQCRDIECPAGRSLYRRDKWNAVAPNQLTATLAAHEERVRELEAELAAWRSGSDLGHQRIEQLERELAEARQREEDSTDLILRQGSELAAVRPKAEAAERKAAALRGGGYDDPMDAADDAILAACPEDGGYYWGHGKSGCGPVVPITDAQPAPTPARWWCQGCGAVEVEGALGWYPMEPHRNHLRRVSEGVVAVCGPCVPVTDAQPAGAAP